MDRATTLTLLVAFGVVVLTTLGNTLLEWYRQHLNHTREARILRCALLQELATHREMVAASMTPEQRNETTGSFMVPVDEFMPVYENMIGKIGLLDPQEVSAVLKAYSYLILAPKNLGIIGQLRKDEFSSFMLVGAEYRDVLAAMNDKITGAIDAAIGALSRRRARP